MKTKRHILLGALLGLATLCPAANEIGFVEQFALADDRAATLSQLIPGTDDYYYYHCLHYQNTDNRAPYDLFLKNWKERNKNAARIEVLENRQALIDYPESPDASLELLRKRLGLKFDYARKTKPAKGLHPTELDPKRISVATYLGQALKAHGGKSAAGIRDEGLHLVDGKIMSPEIRRDLLKRLKRPDFKGLVDLIDADLRHEKSGGFGTMQIHKALLIEQLDALAKKMPGLWKSQKFVHLYVSKLKPNDDVDVQTNPAEMQAYLDRLNKAVEPLGQVFNSLKAHVTYHTLAYERGQGRYDAVRFLAYLKLPRNAAWTNPDYLKRVELRNVLCRLDYSFDRVTLFPPIGNDSGLIQAFLEQFLVKAPSADAYAPYLRDTWLKLVFAETKILHGIGDVERWASMLTPTEFEAIKHRVELEFAQTNPNRFAPKDTVKLELQLKNVKELLVKVYEINAYNYYRDTLKEIDTAINLDGLIAMKERRLRFDQPPEQRLSKVFDFPELAEAGTYVIELIGNGVSSRALVFKGRLDLLSQETPDGYGLMVLDPTHQPAKGATVWMAGKEYTADKNNIIAIPFSTAEKGETVILRQGKQASLAQFHHGDEAYAFGAGFYIDREALIQHREATVMIRPRLALSGGAKVSLDELEDVRLVYEFTDVFGIKTRKEIKDLTWSDHRETLHTLRLPDRLMQIRFELHARIKNISQNTHQDLSATKTFELNGIDRTHYLDALFSRREGAAYTLELRGRNGEPRMHQVLHLEVQHEWFTKAIHVQLQTDEDGRCLLGNLEGIRSYKVRGPNGVYQEFAPARNRVSLPNELQGAENQAFAFAINPEDTDAVLLDIADGQYRQDFSQRITLKDGRLTISGLPAGNYGLWVGDSARIPVRIAKGKTLHGRAFSSTRALRVSPSTTASIREINLKKTGLEVQLADTKRTTRVHIIASRYAPEYDLYNHLRRGARRLGSQSLGQPNTLYVAGRNIGDEYRYILDRENHPKYPGNMAQRPGLLLNPWALRKTDQGNEQLRRGEEYAKKANKAAAAAARMDPGEPDDAVDGLRRASVAITRNFTSLDFLAEGSLIAANLVPDADGIVRVPLKMLNRKSQVRILLLDGDQTILRQVALPGSDMIIQDLRLAEPFDPKVPLSEQKLVTTLRKGKPYTITDLSSSDMELFGSLANVYQLFATLNNPEHFAAFRFLTEWNSLDEVTKQDRYATYASHELNFFIQQKDPAFFTSTVQPYLKNKKDPTFMDDWMTGESLQAYRPSWRFSRLNPVERILLGQRVEADRAGILQHIRELHEVIPVDRTREGRAFDTAIAAGLSSPLGTTTWEFRADSEKANKTLGFAGRAMKPRSSVRFARISDSKGGALGLDLAELGELSMEGEDMDVLSDLVLMPEEAPLPALIALADSNSNGLAERYNIPVHRLRLATVPLFRKLPVTEELAENNYYRLPIEQQLHGLITANRFWVDYAKHPADTPFLSTHFTEATRNLSEMILALAVLDLPFTEGEHTLEQEGARMTLTPAHDVILFHKEIRPAQMAEAPSPLLVSQHFFRADDRWRQEGSEKYEKYVKDEFLQHVVYGCKVILTNPGSHNQDVNLLLQIPAGAIPVNGGFFAKGVRQKVEAHSTRSVEYTFYFPTIGDYVHYPVHVAKNDEIIGQADAFSFKVVKELSKIDKQSWPWISQDASEQDVLDYLDTHNLEETKLEDIAWRMKDRRFFKKVVTLLDQRQKFDYTLYSFAMLHNETAAARAWLNYSPIAKQSGSYIDTPLLTSDPIARHQYQHLEYAPLVNPRVHPVGKDASILNHRLLGQYQAFMHLLSNKAQLDDRDRLCVTYYLALQDRIEEALAWFERVAPENIRARLQHDYMKAYLGMYEGKIAQAQQIATRHKQHPVPRWRNKFLNILTQIEDAGVVIDEDSREQAQDQLAASEPALDLNIEAGRIQFDYQNTASCVLNFYPMDIELLFSRNPFVQSQGRTFSYIEPVLSRKVELPADQNDFSYETPVQFKGQNVMIEAVSGGIRTSKAYYANALNLQVLESYGQVQVTQADTQEALSTVYVKVYAQMSDGKVRFFKDGYTDFRGRFDYVSLNTNNLDQVQGFSILVMSEAHGAMIKEAAPPKR